MDDGRPDDFWDDPLVVITVLVLGEVSLAAAITAALVLHKLRCIIWR